MGGRVRLWIMARVEEYGDCGAESVGSAGCMFGPAEGPMITPSDRIPTVLGPFAA